MTSMADLRSCWHRPLQPQDCLCLPAGGLELGVEIEGFEEAIRKQGKPKHLITDRGTVFTSNAFADFLEQWDIKRRLGAVGKHGSIAVTERVIKTMKIAWLGRVPLILGFDHLTDLCRDFLEWYNDWRPHSFVEDATPNGTFHHCGWRRPERHAKAVPKRIEVKRWSATNVTAFRLKDAA
jgi:hypothetical protein